EPEPEPEPEPKASTDVLADIDISWGNASLQKAFERWPVATSAVAQHEALLAIVAECYKQRKNAPYLQLGAQLAPQYQKVFAASRELQLSRDPKAEFKGVGFMQLSTLCADSGEFAKAISLCQAAIGYGLQDGTVSGFEGRIQRIEKARDKAKG
ncbi:hypothetical protein HR45_14090, partial [Shewanella mangrovi]